MILVCGSLSDMEIEELWNLLGRLAFVDTEDELIVSWVGCSRSPGDSGLVRRLLFICSIRAMIIIVSPWNGENMGMRRRGILMLVCRLVLVVGVGLGGFRYMLLAT